MVKTIKETYRCATVRDLHVSTWKMEINDDSDIGKEKSSNAKYGSSLIIAKFIICMQTFHKSQDPLVPEPRNENNKEFYDILEESMKYNHVIFNLEKFNNILEEYHKYFVKCDGVETIPETSIISHNSFIPIYLDNIKHNVKLKMDSLEVIEIPHILYKKLKNMYTETCGDMKQFDKRLVIMIYRYNALNAWSNCWTLPDTWKKENNYSIELFGAPFNSESPIFGSLFPDVDKYFGGMGDYNHVLEYIGELEEVQNILINPPFIDRVLDDVVQKLDLLKLHNYHMIYPHWVNSEVYKKLLDTYKHIKHIQYIDKYKGGDLIVDTTLFRYTVDT